MSVRARLTARPPPHEVEHDVAPSTDLRTRRTLFLLLCADVFRTIAWYGHLRYHRAPLLAAIIVSWLIAYAECCFQGPANRIGYAQFTSFQLRIIQAMVTLSVFAVLAWAHLGKCIKRNHSASFLFLVSAVVSGFGGKRQVLGS
jgi:hypothetical protein